MSVLCFCMTACTVPYVLLRLALLWVVLGLYKSDVECLKIEIAKTFLLKKKKLHRSPPP